MPPRLSLINTDSAQSDPKTRQNSLGDAGNVLRDASSSPTLTQAAYQAEQILLAELPPFPEQCRPLTCGARTQVGCGCRTPRRRCYGPGLARTQVVLMSIYSQN